MKELELKYGCNPNQKPAKIFTNDGRDLPIRVLNGRPGYINLLDAFNSWQLVKELKAATGMPAAASFKHVSPAGAAVAKPMSDTLKKIYFVDDLELSPIATAYARARGADRMSSYGDWAALSDVCDKETATLLAREVSDGIIAPGYTDEALAILKTKRKGTYNVVEIDPDYKPEPIEHKDVFGITFEQGRNELKIDADMLSASVPDSSPASIAPVWPGTKRTSGSCVNIRKSLPCRLRRTSAALTATTPLTCTSVRSMTTCCATVFGSSFSRRSRRCSPARRKRLGLRRLRAFPWAATRSSRSATTLSARTRAV